ncbi:hypothetical protein ACQPT2_22365 [Erwinia amylovora]
MKKLGLVVLLASVTGIAHAQWSTSVDDDIFSGGKKATMIATIGSYSDSSALIFECTKSALSFAYVERFNQPEKVSHNPVDMFVKIDSGDIKKLESSFEERNDKYIQAGVDDKDAITQILKEASKAKSKIIVGISNDAIGQNSVTANVSGSSKAVNQFATACEIKL